MDAVVVREFGRAALEALELRPVGPCDVLVRIEATGICHSDVSVFGGVLGGRLPVVLGHEGAGTVVEAGDRVQRVRVGDRVVLSAIPACGTCWFCSRAEPHLCELASSIRKPPFVDGERAVAGASGLGTFAEAVVLDERTVIPVHTDLPSDLLSLIGCAVITGAGCTLNIATVRAGTSVLVVGAGGIGLSAIQGARVQGAYPIVAIDPSPQARDAAVRCGATSTEAPGLDIVGTLRELTGGRGFDVVIECVGSAATFTTGYQLTRRGGEMVLVGVGPPDVMMPISIVDPVLAGKRLTGCVYGGTSVHRDVPRYVAMAERGQLDFEALVGRRITLAETPAALTSNHGPGRTIIVNA